MPPVPLDLIAELAKASDVPTIRRLAIDFGTAQGFGGFFVVTPVARDSRQGRIVYSEGFDRRWEKAYRRCLHRIDPLPDIALVRSAPFRWSQAGKLRKLSPAEQRYMAILTRLGMGDGLAFPVVGAGSRFGLIGFGLHPDLDAVPEQTVLKMQLILQSAYLNYSRVVASAFAPDDQLSAREMDVLFWLTQGKSNSAIATILAISPATVDTYIRRVFRKLGVADRVGAAMAGVQHGYVIAGDYPRTAAPDPKS